MFSIDSVAFSDFVRCERVPDVGTVNGLFDKPVDEILQEFIDSGKGTVSLDVGDKLLARKVYNTLRYRADKMGGVTVVKRDTAVYLQRGSR